MDAGSSRIGRAVIMCTGSRENYWATLDPEIYQRLFISCLQGGPVGDTASVKPLGLHSLGKASTTVQGCRG